MARYNLYPANGPALLNVSVRGCSGLNPRAAADVMRKAIVRYHRGRADLFLPQSKPGHIIALPYMTAESDGPEVDVPLDGLRWEVA